jgi:hypothetical protein
MHRSREGPFCCAPTLWDNSQLVGDVLQYPCEHRHHHLEQVQGSFDTHYVPHGTMKLKRNEFADLKQGGMTVNEYLNSFIQLSRYAADDVSTDEKKHDVFLNGLNDDIQF